jgi:hypothetical protein
MTRWNELDFDPDDYRSRPRPRPKGGLLFRLARFCFVLGAVAAVGGAVYLGLRHSASVTDEAGVPLIKADPRPFKVRPDQPGGMEVPNQDKLVFDRLDPDAARPVVERLLPPPETPLPRPVAPPPPPPVAATPAPADAAGKANPGTAGGPSVPAPASVPAAASVATAVLAAAAAGSEAGASPNPPSAGHEKPVKPTLVAAAAVPSSTPAKPLTPPKPLSPSPSPAAVPATGNPAGTGSVHLQLASVRSEAEAREEWKRLDGRYHELLGGLAPSVVKADLGERGIYYRLRAGPLDEARAERICDHLKSQNVGCQLARH